MELNPQTNKKDVEVIVKNLLSRDPVLFNSTLNSHFAASVQYHGHALDIRGSSALKHAAWTFNLVDLGRGAQVRPKDITWNQKETTATIQTTRYLRPLFFPLFSIAVPVTSRLQFHPEGNKGDKGTKPLLYVTKWEDEWPLGRFIETLPLVGQLVQRLLTPLASFLVVLVSNVVFGVSAWLTSAQRQKRAEEVVPPTVRQGFDHGAQLATGWGHRAFDATYSVAKSPLHVIDYSAQTLLRFAAPLLPFKLEVSVFDPQPAPVASRSSELSEPVPIRAQRDLHAEETHNKRTPADDETNPRGAAQHADTADIELPAAMAAPQDDIQPAKVVVGSGVSGNQSQGGSYNIPAHQFNDAKHNPHKLADDEPSRAAPRGDNAGKPSLFDEARKDGKELKKAEAAAPDAPSGGGTTLKKKKSKRASVDHSAPPKFEDGLDDGQIASSDNAGRATGARTTPPPLYQEEESARTAATKTKKKKSKSPPA